jgi:hypothetical protein
MPSEHPFRADARYAAYGNAWRARRPDLAPEPAQSPLRRPVSRLSERCAGCPLRRLRPRLARSRTAGEDDGSLSSVRRPADEYLITEVS